jgi:hypothetical protein
MTNNRTKNKISIQRRMSTKQDINHTTNSYVTNIKILTDNCLVRSSNNTYSTPLKSNTMSDNEDDGLWEKPSWAKGGAKLKKTGRGDAMKHTGNLAAAITFTPYKNEDHSNKVANQGGLRQSDVGEAVKSGENLACPITHIREEMMINDSTNKVANQGRLRQSEVGEAAKAGQDLAAPVTYTPYKNEDHTNYVANPQNLRRSDVGEAAKAGEDLAMPITHIRDAMRER